MSIDSEFVTIWRAPGGDYHIEWQASHPDTRVTVEPMTADAEVTAHYSTEPSPRALVSGLPADSRHFFRLRDQHGNEVVATERRLGMEGTPNFRDFGGYRGSEGRQVKWGYLFRSGHLARLTERDLVQLEKLELDLICDFRQESEQADEPNRLPRQRLPRVCSLPIAPGDNSGFLQQLDGPLAGPEPMFNFMVAVNAELVEAQAPAYTRMFAAILECDQARFLVHCAAGKDRTGFAAAIILLSLGVPRETVMRDYLLSGQFYNAEAELEGVRTRYKLTNSDGASVLPMLQVHEAYLNSALAAIDKRYGGVETYLREALGVGTAELAELRGRYLALA